ncbi:hypothetical protein ACEN32_11015 [Marinilactibacillus psychrotolerans]|uniref:hypothetical protein n=1 Tax=Marinilactibacillus psychrotolerans TaxID=191770 RepID=UPI003885766B
MGYFGLGFIKSFIQKEIEPWIHHRIRQLILKRWKLPKTKNNEVIKIWIKFR